MTPADDLVALLDLDDSLAAYSKALRLQMVPLAAPGEPEFTDRELRELPHLEARRKLIQRQPGFWRDLEPIPEGFEVVSELQTVGFGLHVATKGPRSTPGAWSEKLEWCLRHLPETAVTIAGDKSLIYARVLYDDFPPYFVRWLAVRPRGLVICLAHPWNEAFAKGGPEEHPNVFRYDGTNRQDLRLVLQRAYNRAPRAPL